MKKSSYKERLIGIKVSSLSDARFPQSLFTHRKDEKREKVHAAVGNIREKFGHDSIYRAGARWYTKKKH